MLLPERHLLTASGGQVDLGVAEVYNDVILIYLCWSQDLHELNSVWLLDALHSCIPKQTLDNATHLLVYAWPDEAVEISSMLMLEEKLCGAFPEIPKIILYNRSAKHPETFDLLLENTQQVTWISVDFFALRCYFLYKDRSFEWNPGPKKMFWMVGNPGKCERIVPFYIMVESGFTEKYLSYSFDPAYASDMYDQCWQLLGTHIIKVIAHSIGYQSPLLAKDFAGFDYAAWAEKNKRSLDVSLGTSQFDGSTDDLIVYNTHCGEIIAETIYEKPWFRTEKTYRSIMLGYPVLFLGTHFAKKMNQDGYRTFEKYVDWDYDYPEHEPFYNDHQSYITETHKLMTGVEQFVVRCKQPEVRAAIRADIKHNREHLCAHVENSLVAAQRLVPNIQDIMCFSAHLNRRILTTTHNLL